MFICDEFEVFVSNVEKIEQVFKTRELGPETHPKLGAGFQQNLRPFCVRHRHAVGS